MDIPDHSGGVTFRSEKQMRHTVLMVFVKQVETGMLQCFSRTAKDKWSYIKRLTNHQALIQQLHYCSKVQLSDTDRCYTFKQINLVSWEVDTIYILDTTLVWHLQNIPLSVSKMCLLNPVSCPWRQKKKPPKKPQPFYTLVFFLTLGPGIKLQRYVLS